jgi:AraC-like DNA-binding protein
VTLAGAFVYHVGRERSLVDPNRVAFVNAGETSCDSGSAGADVTCLVLTPAAELVDGRRLPRTAPASARLQIAAARFVAATRASPALEPLVVEEAAIRLVDTALAAAGRAGVAQPSAATRLAERARALLPPAGPPVGLVALARRLAVSPAYLSDAFRRAEGLPLVRYQLRLRLCRALTALADTDDLTALALELGFSSHSHFTTAFRMTMGQTPSQMRRELRARTIQRT